MYIIGVEPEKSVIAASFALAGSNLSHVIIAQTYIKVAADTTALLDSEVLMNNQCKLKKVDRTHSRI